MPDSPRGYDELNSSCAASPPVTPSDEYPWSDNNSDGSRLPLLQTQRFAGARDVTPPRQLSRIGEAVENICLSNLYVGSKDLKQHVKWQKFKNHDTLVLKDGREPGVPAEIEWIGQVNPDAVEFKLFVCGDWRLYQNSLYPNVFTSAKARGQIVKPDTEDWRPVSDIWDDIIEGFLRIEESKSVPCAADNPYAKCRIVEGDAMNIRHIIFEPKHEAEAEVREKLQAGFAMKDWRCCRSEAQEELRKVIKEGKYEGVPLPALDIYGNPIPPAKYEEQLRGALVHVKANITHQHISSGRRDNFFADVCEIRVVSPPVVEPKSPSKKRFLDKISQQDLGRAEEKRPRRV
ncbi:hypothetical protein AcW1_009168 [Taiwanofungus camphoratus]|nr:hypothetical protein AcV5_007190 [Antrodia cinnamomea]KAI0949612.1 hypothetical protein AcW1_009168 [Antrodia cinnamomea]